MVFVAVGDHVNDPLCGRVVYFRSCESFGDSVEGDVIESTLDVQEDTQDVSFLSYSPFDFVSDFVQGCFSGTTLSEAELPLVQVSGDVEIVLHVPQQLLSPGA